MIAGVCAGAGRYFDVDPVIFRVILGVLVFFGGVGLAIYGVCWLLLPEDGRPTTRLERWLTSRSDRRRDVLLMVVALVLVVWLLHLEGLPHRLTAVFLVVVAILAVLTLASRQLAWWRGTSLAASSPPPSGPLTAESLAWADTTTVMTPPVPRERSRPRSWLGLLVLAATLLVGGVLGLIAASRAGGLQPADVTAACVGVVGLGLLVGAVAGRARAVIPLGLVLVAALAATDALPRDLTWTAGNRTWVPMTAVRAPYVLGAGDASLTLDSVAPGTATVATRIGAGRLRIYVPPTRSVIVHAHVGAGHVVVLGDQHDGLGLDVRQLVAGTRPGLGVITLNVSMGYGDIEVINDAAA